MPTNAEIKALADQLQISLDAEQAQVAALLQQKDDAIAALNTTIATLQGQVADGGTAEERQAIIDELTATKADLEATVAP